ncbi:MAG: hypothetical protein LW832_01085 [Parachlamydia sp.]|nr:hypothetical protein [Parachlamydia sp.]
MNFLRLSLVAGLILMQSNRLQADLDLCETERNQIAVGLAAVTVVGLTAGIVYLSSCSSRKHCHSHCGGCSSSYDCSSWSSSCYSSSYSSHHHHHHHSSCSTDYSTHYTSHFPSSYYENSHNIFNNGPIRQAVTGSFNLPKTDPSTPCQLTPYIKMPDGSIEYLSPVTLSSSETTIPFGPYFACGLYTFALKIDHGTIAAGQTGNASVIIERNDSSTQKLDLAVQAVPSDVFAEGQMEIGH